MPSTTRARFNPLFSGLTLKAMRSPISAFVLPRFQSPIFGADAQRGLVQMVYGLLEQFQSPIFGADAQRRENHPKNPANRSFNPLFSGLTLKGQ